MATRVENIILRARDTLADPNKNRYSDARLLRLVSEGQQDIVKQSKILRSSFTLLASADKAVYDLPTDVWQLTRASYKGIELPFRTYDEFDYSNNNYKSTNTYSRAPDFSSYYPDNYSWTETKGPKPEALVYDRVNMHQVRVYPIPNENISDNTYYFTSDLGVVTDINGAIFNSLFGVITNITATDYSVYFDTFYGVLTNVQEAVAPIVIHYFKTVGELETVNSNLLTPPMFDVALKHFVVSQALRDDIDIQNRQMGAEAFTLYNRELELAKSTSAINNVTNRERTISYSGPFQN